MQIFKASYSTLSVWATGNVDLAVAMYFKRAEFDTEPMAFGREMHNRFEAEIKASGNMPAVFGARKIYGEHRVEVFAVKQLAPWLELRGKLDLLEVDGRVGKDWKTGKGQATQYTRSYQHRTYQILYPYMNRFEYHVFNQYTGKVTVSVVHLSERTLREGIDWIVTHASAMKDYIERNNLEAYFASLPPSERIKAQI